MPLSMLVGENLEEAMKISDMIIEPIWIHYLKLYLMICLLTYILNM